MKNLSLSQKQIFYPTIYMIVFFLFWEICCYIFKIPVYFLPSPMNIIEAFNEFSDAIIDNSIQTFYTTFVGFGMAIIFGLMVGILIGWSNNIYAGLYPIMVGFNSIPKVAVVPILVLWFGYGISSKIVIGTIIVFFPIASNFSVI